MSTVTTNDLLEFMRKNMATKDDIAKIYDVMATKDDIAKIYDTMATKDDIAKIYETMATKDDITELRLDLRKTEHRLLDHMRSTDRKVDELTSVLQDKELLTTNEVRKIQSMGTLPNTQHSA